MSKSFPCGRQGTNNRPYCITRYFTKNCASRQALAVYSQTRSCALCRAADSRQLGTTEDIYFQRSVGQIGVDVRRYRIFRMYVGTEIFHILFTNKSPFEFIVLLFLRVLNVTHCSRHVPYGGSGDLGWRVGVGRSRLFWPAGRGVIAYTDSADCPHRF